jgi:MYXO-CTERM domain-containing protein
MRKPIVFLSPFLATVAVAAGANAATYYVSPTGTATMCCSHDAPCDLQSGANAAIAGDTVILMDGVYTTSLSIPNAGTASAWITFQADACAVPIIQGPGVDPLSTNQDAGVSSSVATYVRFEGIVSTGWSTGFGNGWTGTDTTTSNGHFEFKNCIADFNGRTGFTFFSAEGIHIQNSIAAHNGSSIMESWSSGITLYEAQGGSGASVIEGNLSFENMDNHDVAQSPNEAGMHSDGSGFIIDEFSDGATFVNNVAFGNGGSCLRLTKSANAIFANNTCYHNAQDTRDAGPSDPGELYFTDAPTRMGVNFVNDVLAATGSTQAPSAVRPSNGKPTSGYTNNTESTGAVTYFTDPDGTHPDFTLAAASTTLIGKGMAGTGVPTNDIGFDPKCVVKKTPTPIGMMVNGSWWKYSIDYDYIKSIGGVGKCFSPKTRASPLDIGAYANGAVTTTAAGSCVPPTPPTSGDASSCTTSTGGMGGTGAGGMSSATGGVTAAGGAGPSGGMGNVAGGAPGVGGAMSAGGSPGSGGSSGSPSGATAGSGVSTGGTATTTGGTGGTATATGGSSTTTGGSSTTGTTGGSSTTGTTGGSPSAGSSGSGGSSSSGCGCRVAEDSPGSSSLAVFGLVGLAALGVRRRRSR